MSPTLLKKTDRYSTYENYPYWYIAATSKELKQKPIRVFLWGTPIVLFRDESGTAHALPAARCTVLL